MMWLRKNKNPSNYFYLGLLFFHNHEIYKRKKLQFPHKCSRKFIHPSVFNAIYCVKFWRTVSIFQNLTLFMYKLEWSYFVIRNSYFLFYLNNWKQSLYRPARLCLFTLSLSSKFKITETSCVPPGLIADNLEIVAS